MKKTLIALLILLVILNAPSLVEFSSVAAESSARGSHAQADQLVGEDKRTDEDRERRTGPSRGEVTGEFQPNPKFPSYPKTPTETTMNNGCPCGEDCQCPDPRVCEQGNCRKNYVAFFTAAWCSACHKMYPAIEELRKAGYIVYVLDIDKFPKSAEKFKVEALPTTVVMDQGKEIARFVGVVSNQKITSVAKTKDEQADSEPLDYKLTD